LKLLLKNKDVSSIIETFTIFAPILNKVFMSLITMNANEVQQLVFQIFGNGKITANTTGNTMVITAAEKENISSKTTIDTLCGMFKNTNLLSSDDFARNKEHEKKLEEKKLNHE
jgi:hypothetical protein